MMIILGFQRFSVGAFVLWASILQAQSQVSIVPNGPLEFCGSNSVTLCVEPAHQAYLWNTGSTLQCIDVLESGDYYAIVVDSAFNIDSSLVYTPVTVVVHEPEPYVGIVNDTIFVNESFETYQWYMDGNLLPGETDNYLVPTVSAYYHVEVTDEFGCTGSSPIFSPPFPFPSSIEEIVESEIDLSVYPNPANSIVTITLAEPNTQHQTRVNLYDVHGRVLQVPTTVNAAQVQLDMTNLPSGIYFGRFVGDPSTGSGQGFKVVRE